MKPLTFRDLLKAGRIAKKKGLVERWDRYVFLDGALHANKILIEKNKEGKCS